MIKFSDSSTQFLRLIPQLECYPAIVSFVEGWKGRICIFVAFTLILSCLLHYRVALAITLGAAACAFFGRYRYQLLMVITMLFLLVWNMSFPLDMLKLVLANEGVLGKINLEIIRLVALIVLFLFSTLVLYMAHCFRRVSTIKPILSLLTFFAFILLLASIELIHGIGLVMLWVFVSTLGCYFWFLGYALLKQGNKDHIPLLLHFGTFHPFWGSTSVPFGKGVAYLKKFEALNSQDLSITQLKGFKLISWVLILSIVKNVFVVFIHTQLQIPLFVNVFNQHVLGNLYPWHICWASLISMFIENLLSLAIMGGQFIACARMAGFRLLRNTYRPLEARSVAEFWNRYYFYFKEVLVDFFFYPTFIRYFRDRPRLRLFFATFMAAGIGNMIYHFIRDISYVATLGPMKAVLGYQPYAFYCTVLAIGIGISQLRGQEAKKNSPHILRRMVSTTSIILFYCCLQVFDYVGRDHSLMDHFRFFFHLFGIDVF